MGEGGKSSNHAQKKIADNLGGQSMYPVFGRGQKKKSEHLLSKHVCDPVVIAIAGRNQGGISKNKPTIQPAGRCRRSIRMDIKTKLETPASVCVCGFLPNLFLPALRGDCSNNVPSLRPEEFVHMPLLLMGRKALVGGK